MSEKDIAAIQLADAVLQYAKFIPSEAIVKDLRDRALRVKAWSELES